MNSVFVRFSFWLGTSLTGFLPSFAFWVVLHWKAIRLALLSARVTFLWMDRVFTGFLPSSFFVWSRWPRSRFSFTSQTKKMISPRALLPFFLNVLIVGYGLVFYRVFYRVFFLCRSSRCRRMNENAKRLVVAEGRWRDRGDFEFSLSLSLSPFFHFLFSLRHKNEKGSGRHRWPTVRGAVAADKRPRRRLFPSRRIHFPARITEFFLFVFFFYRVSLEFQ